MKIYGYFIIAFMPLLSGCFHSKRNYKGTVSLFSKDIKCNCKLYVEVYNVGIMNNLNSDYLTDSVNFRIYTGTFDDENGYIYYKCSGDSITVGKKEQINQIFKIDSSVVDGKRTITPNLNYTLKTTNKTTYSLTDLKKRHTFEWKKTKLVKVLSR
jgi:hypothetical protein